MAEPGTGPKFGQPTFKRNRYSKLPLSRTGPNRAKILTVNFQVLQFYEQNLKIMTVPVNGLIVILRFYG